MSRGKKRFTDTQAWKNISNVIINLGAALVIVGALFKIQGWPNASLMLTIGMGVEAIIFALGALDSPASLPDWARIYPQLDKDYEGELPASQELLDVDVAGVSKAVEEYIEEIKTASRSFSKIAQMSEDSRVPETLLSFDNSIKGGITTLDDFENRCSDINASTTKFASAQTKQIEAQEEYIKEIRTASRSFNKIAQMSEDSRVPETLLSFDNSMKGSITTLDNFENRCSDINASTTKFVSSQTKQIEAQETYTKGIFNMYSEINKLQTKVKESIDDLTEYNAKNKTLNASIAELNSIYGEVLSTSRETVKNI